MENRLSYQDFQKRMLESVSIELNRNGAYQCQIVENPKNNVLLTGLQIRQEGSMMAQVFYLEDDYQEFLKGKPIKQISQELAAFYRNQELPDFSMFNDVDYNKVKDKLRVRLVNRENNQAYYKQGPYRLHPLGAEVLYIEWERQRDGSLHMPVTNAMAEKWMIPEKEMFDTALENTWSNNTISFWPLSELSPATQGVPLYYLGNEAGEYGATAVLYPDVLLNVRERLGDDYYILPASVHELLILKKQDLPLNVKALRDLVKDMNQNVLKPEDILGNEVFEFRESMNKVKICKKEERER